MAQKNDIKVVINNKVYTLSGQESEDYLQNVATYINGKIAECFSHLRRTGDLTQSIRMFCLH